MAKKLNPNVPLSVLLKHIPTGVDFTADTVHESLGKSGLVCSRQSIAARLRKYRNDKIDYMGWGGALATFRCNKVQMGNLKKKAKGEIVKAPKVNLFGLDCMSKLERLVLYSHAL
jgi:hypothetical protein